MCYNDDNISGLVFAIGAAFEPDSVNVRKAPSSADERMYEDKSSYYRLRPQRIRSSMEN